jgi:hypothetical protein
MWFKNLKDFPFFFLYLILFSRFYFKARVVASMMHDPPFLRKAKLANGLASLMASLWRKKRTRL